MIGDFDNDNQSDIAIIYSDQDIECMIYNYYNSSLKRNEKTAIESFGTLDTILVHDINNDHHSDIIICIRQSYGIYVLFGYGNNQFYPPVVYLIESQIFRNWLAVADFNNDNYQDIISINEETMLIDVFLYNHECFID